MIVYFRATAILLIVAGHSYGISGVRLETGLDDYLSSLIKGATALFVFISGFLFDYVHSARFEFRRFLIDRATRLLIPYCVLTILAGLMFSNWAGGKLSSGQLFRDFALGDTFQAYWYVPFIMLMFALAPLHRRFMALGAPHQLAIIIAGAFVSGLVQRPIGNDNALQSIVFYMPIYLSGLYLSLHYKALMPTLERNWPRLLSVVVLLATVQSLGGQSGNMHKSFFAIRGFELMVFQKLALAFALVGFFARFSSPPGRIIRIVADTSFAIFFLHPFVLKLLRGSDVFHLTRFPWINLAVAVATIVALCAIVALGLRAILKANSKYLIGY